MLSGAVQAVELTAEQNGDHKLRYRIVYDGTNGCAAAIGGSAISARLKMHPISPLPVVPSVNMRLVPVGDQHLALEDGDGARKWFYHVVTDRWVATKDFRYRKGFGPVAWCVVALYFLMMTGMALHFMRKKKSADDYFRGGGRIPYARRSIPPKSPALP